MNARAHSTVFACRHPFTGLFSGALLAALLTVGCSGRVPASVERDAARETLNWVDTNYGVIRDETVDRFLRRVAARLDSAVPAAGREHESDAALEGGLIRYPWQIFVTKQPAANAFSIGGGVILISRGLVESAGTEAELAAIIAHEMSHQLLGHTREALSAVLSSDVKSGDTPAISYSEERELEADALSLRLLMLARYDARHALYALLIGHGPSPYRPQNTGVASPAQQERLARLYQAMSECPGPLPGTQTSREFLKVRARLEQR